MAADGIRSTTPSPGNRLRLFHVKHVLFCLSPSIYLNGAARDSRAAALLW
jgi:hypothetical protein